MGPQTMILAFCLLVSLDSKSFDKPDLYGSPGIHAVSLFQSVYGARSVAMTKQNKWQKSLRGSNVCAELFTGH